MIKTFKAYSRDSYANAFYPNKGNNLVYTTLGLCGEAGEFAEKVKKCLRDSGGELTEEKRDAMVKELGDVLWYLNATAMELNTTLEHVAGINLDKVNGRKVRGTLGGDGDDR